MIIPIFDRAILKLDELETKTASGIILAVDEKRERKAVEYGTIISINTDSHPEKTQLPSIGDYVSIAKYSGKQIVDTDGTEYVAINIEDIIAIIKD